MTAPTDRPDPDALLAAVRSAEAHSRRGLLKIYLGAAPGVGKTFAMLSAARRLAAQGTDVVVGMVESHGRAETQALAIGLEAMPRRQVEYRGKELLEFDLDAALQRRPAVILLDELAHTNAPGARFEKRWQDVRALLEARIDVHTTLNVQHIESLNDVVARLTAVHVRETVPDSVLDAADEVEVVDLAPDVLLERLRAGRVYVPEAARTAIDSYFHKGNLSALRELALRKTAQLVDRRRRDDRQPGGRSGLSALERVLVCVGPSPLSARLVRAAHRMAAVVRGELFAVFVANNARQLSAADQDRVLQNLRLAGSLGVRTATVEGSDAAQAIVDFARQHEISRIVIGKTGRSRLHDLLFGSFTMDVIRKSRDIDLYVIHGEPEDEAEPHDEVPAPAPRGPVDWRAHSMAAVCTAAALLVAWLVHEPPDLSAEALVLILGVAVTALRWGRWPAVVAAVLSALCFNFLFLEPRFAFSLSAPSYLFAFLVMLVVGLSLSSLLAQARERAQAAREREGETTALLSLTRELADTASVEDIGRVTLAHLRDVVAADMAMLVAPAGETVDIAGLVASRGSIDWLGPGELAAARWCWDHGKAAGAGTGNLPGTRALFLPLQSRRGKEAVLGLRAPDAGPGPSPKQRLLLETFSEQAALAFERVRLAEERQRARKEAETERLRSTLLSSVSHDLRTPLTTITGAASSLVHEGARLDDPTRQQLASSILGQAQRLNDLIANLVFATRLESGGVELRRQWTSIEEVLGAAVKRAPLQQHRVALRSSSPLPLVDADPVLLEQALYNLLENASRHTPAGTLVEVAAWIEGTAIVIEVADDGPGIQAREHGSVFRPFARGPRSGGLGLGLAICEGIVKAHGGRAWIEPGRARGVAFRILLPLPPSQPQVEEASEADRGTA